MRTVEQRRRSRGTIVAVGLLTLAVLTFGAGISRSDDPPADPCEGLEADAEGYCRTYCETLDCDGEPADADACLVTLERYIEVTGEAPPCEAAPEQQG